MCISKKINSTVFWVIQLIKFKFPATARITISLLHVKSPYPKKLPPTKKKILRTRRKQWRINNRDIRQSTFASRAKTISMRASFSGKVLTRRSSNIKTHGTPLSPSRYSCLFHGSVTRATEGSRAPWPTGKKSLGVPEKWGISSEWVYINYLHIYTKRFLCIG